MGRLIILATVVALAVAKPELYKEKEDFQYARSSSDEGTKSGSYGAQRGNMGGNYERAHNMDYLAQHQMGSLVSQVHGELGDAAKAKTGNVFASSNSRGMYGSGHYDLSNVQGRNFQEGVSFEDSMAAGQSSAYKHSAATQNFAHTGNTNNYRQYAGQSGQTGLTGQYLLGANDAEHLYTNNYARNQDAMSSHYLQSGYQEQKAYEHGSSNQYATSGQNSDVRTRLISARPIRVVVRPGSTVTVPVAAQTFDSTHRHIGSVYDQNSFNTEAEDLNSIDTTKNIIIPTNKAKHYESSYSYQKEWEKHDTKPVAVPLGIQTENPLANERYISGGLDSESHVNQASGYQAARLSNSHNSYNTKSSQALHNSGYNAQQQHYGSSSQAYQQDIEKANQDALAATLIKNKPSNYQSSYSYHKSWERQGDPYVIKPSSYNQQTQRLTDASAISSHHYGSQNRKGYQQNSQIIEDCDCEEDQGHIRMVRSYDQKFIQQSQNLEDLGQQKQNLEDLGQQTQNLEDLGQLNQGHWQNADDLGQQIQQQNQWGNLQDLGQQSQTQWGNLDDLGQQSQGNEDLEQQLQNNWASWRQNTAQQAEKNWNNAEQKVQGQWIADNYDAKYANTLKKTESSTTKPNNPELNHNLEIHRYINEHKWQLNQNSQSQNDINNQQVFWNYYPHHSFHHSRDNWHTGYHQTQITQHNSDEGVGSVFKKPAEKPLNNLWDKINNLDRDSASFDQNTETRENWWHRHNDQNEIDTSTKTIPASTTTVKMTERNEIEMHSVNVGRGDIGSETEDVIKPTENTTTFYIQEPFDAENNYKTPEEIEALSLTKPSQSRKKDSNNDTHIDESLKVLGLSEHADLQKNAVDLQNKKHVKENSAESLDSQQNEKFDQQSTLSHNLDKFSTQQLKNEEQPADFGQQADKIYQQNKWIGNSAENVNEQQLVQFNNPQQHNNFEQQSQSTWGENLEAESQRKPKDQNQQSVSLEQSQSSWGGNLETESHQKPKDKNQQVVNFEQQSQSSWGPNLETELQHEGQHQQNLNQDQQSQSSWEEPLESLSHQKHENTEQQLTDFTQQNENLEQQFQSADQLESFYNHGKVADEHQQLTEFTKPNENFQAVSQQKPKYQHNINSEQQSQSTWEQNRETVLQHEGQHQQNLNLDQQSQSTWEAPLESLSHQKQENTEQQLTDFTQQNENLEQQFQSADQLESFPNHGKVVNEHQQLTEFTKPNENFHQKLEKIEQTIDNHHKSFDSSNNHFDTFGRQSSNIIPEEVNKKAEVYEGVQQHEKSEKETNNWGQNTDDLQQNIQQQTQGTWEEIQPHQFTYNKQRLSVQDPKTEELIVPKKIADVEMISPESITTKPGFWKSVGNKFVSAKDKVATWFQKSN